MHVIELKTFALMSILLSSKMLFYKPEVSSIGCKFESWISIKRKSVIKAFIILYQKARQLRTKR